MFEKIISNYDIELKSITKLNKGYASNKWMIIDSLENQYVLKEVVKQDFERLNFILTVQDQVKNFSPSIKRCKDNSMFCKYDDKLYYLSSFVVSDFIAISDDLYYDLGVFLARLHLKLKEIDNVIKMKFLKIENNKEELEKLLSFYNDKQLENYINMINYKMDVLNYIEQKTIRYDNLSYQIVHGDFYLDNILLSNNEYKILDFDQTCYFYKEYELLRGMFMLCLDINLSKETVFINMRKFIKGYSSNNVISSPKDAYYLYLYIQTNSLSGMKKNEYLDEERMKFAIKRFNILKFLYENEEEIINILGGK